MTMHKKKRVFHYTLCLCCCLLLLFSIALLSQSDLRRKNGGTNMLKFGVPYQSRYFQKMEGRGRRMLIGSTRPMCTYNECRGCRSKCRAEQIPVDANDPINSAYHYRCVCHY